jgi:hypothetical protein
VATANTIISRAMRLGSNLGVGEALSAAEAQNGLEALNAMLDSWANDNMFVFVLTNDIIPITANIASYTIGPTGGTVSVRPIAIDPATYLDIGIVSYPLQQLTTNQYGQVTLKTLAAGIPQAIWYNPTFPNATLTLYPIPSTEATLNLWTTKQITSFPLLTTILNMPPGYEDAIVMSLAEIFGLEFGVEPSQTLARKAMLARKAIKRTNFRPSYLQVPNVLTNSGANFYSG